MYLSILLERARYILPGMISAVDGITGWFYSGADPKGGLGGIKPPYFPNINGYPLSTPFIFRKKL